MAFLGGVFCPYPCWSMSTIPPYKTTQVVVNMEHSDVTCKIITQSGNHQYNHSQSLWTHEVHWSSPCFFIRFPQFLGSQWAPKRAPCAFPRCRIQHLWRIQRLARHRALRELHRAERGGRARSCQRFLPAPGPGGLRRLDGRWGWWGAAGLGQVGLLNMAILMAIESQCWKKKLVEASGSAKLSMFFGMIFTSLAEVLVGNSWITTCNMKTPWKLGIWL